jgi:hypothetical protein
MTPSSPPAPTNPESKREIHVVPGPVENVPPPVPGSAKDRMFQDLRKRAKNPSNEAQPTEQSPPPAPADSKPAAPETPKGAAETTPPSTAPSTEGQPAAEKKPSPWKIVDTVRAENAELRKQLAERKDIPEKERTEYQERLTKAETRAKELEEEIRFVNYRKSDEFQKQYQEPYERAWKVAMSELGELTVKTPDGERAMTDRDMLELVNLPLARAREVAEQAFGSFADDILAHRITIRSLFEAQSAALDDAKKNGEAREKDRTEKYQRSMGTVQKAVTDHWNTVNESLVKDEVLGKLFRPVEGDKAGNDRLAKGFEMVDRAWKENPMDLSLTPEQRQEIIERHAAVRNRAAAFGRLRYQNEQLAKQVKDLEDRLKAYQSSTPPIGGDTPSSDGGQESSAKATVYGALRKLAK